MSILYDHSFWWGVLSAAVVAIIMSLINTVIPLQAKRFYIWLDLRKITKEAKEKYVTKIFPFDPNRCISCDQPTTYKEPSTYIRSFKDNKGNLFARSVSVDVCPQCKDRVKPILRGIMRFLEEFGPKGIQVFHKSTVSEKSEIAPENIKAAIKRSNKDIIDGNVKTLGPDWKVTDKK
jgi:hypothetical protein